MYRLLLLLLSSQCVAAHCVTCHATVRCCPLCHPSCRCAVLPIVLPSSSCVLGCGVLPVSPPPCCPLCVGPWCAAHVATAATLPVMSPLSGCVSGRGVLPASSPLPHCPLCRHRVCVRPQCATCVAATAVLPPACRAVVCCPRCHHHCAARRVTIEWLCVGPRCAARVAAAAALPVVSPSSGCVSGRGVLPASSPPPRCPLCHCQAVACSSVLLPALPPPPRCSSCRCWAIVCRVAVCRCSHCCRCSYCAAHHLTVGRLCVVLRCDPHHHHTACRVAVRWLCVVQ